MRTTTILGTTTGALLLVALTACGGASSSSTTTAPANQPDFTAYADCMAQNGVTLPDMGQPPEGGALPSGAPSGPPAITLPDGVDQAAYDKAQTACASLRPAMRPGGGAPANLDQTAVAAFKSCLTDHDVTIPDGDTWIAELDRTDATVKAAMDTCSPLLPQPSASQ